MKPDTDEMIGECEVCHRWLYPADETEPTEHGEVCLHCYNDALDRAEELLEASATWETVQKVIGFLGG